jgi:hypothetical protein
MKLRGRSGGWVPALAFAVLAGAASAQIQPGREFYRIDPPRVAAADGRIEVIEVIDHLVRLAREERLR